jgi:hypothetical protein
MIPSLATGHKMSYSFPIAWFVLVIDEMDGDYYLFIYLVIPSTELVRG